MWTLNTKIDQTTRLATRVATVSPLFIASWVVFSVPLQIVLFQPALVAVLVGLLGLGGILFRRSVAVSLTFGILMTLMILGEVYAHIFGQTGLDTAIFMLQFIMILFLYEISNVVLRFDKVNATIRAKEDDWSKNTAVQIRGWMRRQLLSLGKLSLGAVGLSLALVVFGGFANVSINQLGFTALLAMTAVIAVLFLLTYKREPNQSSEIY